MTVQREKEEAEERKRVEEEEAAAEAARAEAAANPPPVDPAADGEAEAEEQEDPRSEPSEASEVDLDGEKELLLDLETSAFGHLWLSFEDSARVVVSMDYEKWTDPTDRVYSPKKRRPGVQVLYLTQAGFRFQVLSDGTLVQSWPLAPSASEEFNPKPLLGLGVEPSAAFLPGSKADEEISRSILRSGIVCRTLLSGRVEVLHPDGTFAWRNPTEEELQGRVEALRRVGGAQLDTVVTMMQVYQSGFLRLASITPASLEAGIPGHWLVTRLDGTRVGRAACPQLPDPVEPPPAAAPAAGEEAPAEPAAPEQPELDPAEAELRQQLLNLPGAVEAQGTVEYDLPAVDSHRDIDPHTQQNIFTNSASVLRFDDRDGKRRTCLFGDGTRLEWAQTSSGYEVVVQKQRLAKVVCGVEKSAYTPKTKLIVECHDGTFLEITPQVINDKGELVEASPNRGAPPPTNAGMILRRPDGSIVRSFGDGEVDVIPKSMVVAMGEKEVLQRPNKENTYVAHCHSNELRLDDSEGNNFIVRGDNTLQVELAVSISGEEETASPRCEQSMVPYKHPDSAFLPLPTATPEPRLFVVYGDGEGEEILSPGTVAEIMRMARSDANTAVVDGDPLGTPMLGCSSHTIFTETSSCTPAVPVSPLRLPPIIAGSDLQMDQPWAGSAGMHQMITKASPAAAVEDEAKFTMFRQLIEYPAIPQAAREQYLAGFEKYGIWEREHAAAHEVIGKQSNARNVAQQ